MAELARASSQRGDVVLSRRDRDAAVELRVNGVFVMDTVETSTERSLVDAVLAALAGEEGRTPVEVLVAGLGLGFTLRAVLASPGVSRVVVAEIEPAIVDWHRQGLVPNTQQVVTDPRVEVVVTDVADLLAEVRPASFDVVLLDVDNGPGSLVYDLNARIYRRESMRLGRRALRPGGALAIWSADRSAPLAAALSDVFGGCQETALPVRLGTRETSYHLFVARRLT